MSLVLTAFASLSRWPRAASLAPRAMSNGHIRDDASGSFAKREKAAEEQYFRKEQQKAIDSLKGHLHDEIENHKEEIRRLQESIKRHEEKVKKLEEDKPKE